MLKSVIAFFIVLLFSSCEPVKNYSGHQKDSTINNEDYSSKINGLSFVSPPKQLKEDSYTLPKTIVAADWLCFMPFGFIESNSNKVQYNTDWQWWGEKRSGIIEMLVLAKKLGYKSMLKPQLWRDHSSYTGHHQYNTENDWESFEFSYRKFILEFAILADSLEVEIFCIGTELEKFVINRPEYWKSLIADVRDEYRGKITYAANWDEFKRTPFWKELDFIGIDAYFPLSDAQSPSVDELKAAWMPHQNLLKFYSDSIKKPILFTEYGYRSRDFATKSPWEHDRGGIVNLQIQVNAYEALFQEFWDRPYFAGGFLWKWFPDYSNSGGIENSGFTPQRKPVEQTIAKYYGLNSSD
ncbi:MAG: glycoside hydrolase [Bacteroidetes bacterium]|nr:MAG: glycoside hydrolase [Bacteroidota bacterium]MBL1143439.1 glycoside hydrolase [Bacteroidota bacterium]NOG56243.1 glycoside hydrolase [Bacteroidota bacterium]